ncbi:MAG TPA: electron transfer flavoprotein subunit alpha/FixB family protein [Syntrophales bacterium]|nr:electron transfer flavoprotein subunit alpha/FixB family protein [Syntrophales bacterium]HPC32732.1 electron transfer flavoprotein subunit alpha/FixB family protein [Syntrophales bacterium]HRR48173.1 electron transfer flavoprotein subunit alpha/FixB family protein [Syntrophales bacterium]HRU89105.1 electron transfer flavoprotein subunit alpha/FixB family protein [Syntrophales bacterium]
MAGIWIIAEKNEQVLELLTPAGQLAAPDGGRITVVVPEAAGNPEDCFAAGAAAVLLLAPLPGETALGAWLPVLEAEIKAADPDVVLLAATSRGKELAARLAARLETGLCSNCLSLIPGPDGSLVMERLAYGGAALQRVTVAGRPVMATIPPRTFPPAATVTGREGEVRKLPPPPPDPVRIVARKEKERSAQDITAAKTVVCVGRGVEKREDLDLARQLAAALGGELGCTRPISEELHWLPDNLCIGLSGVQVKPELYIGLGVSGQIQHLTGLRGARMICAVNRDPNAPVFAAADLGIVGDLYEVTPKLIEELKKLRG